MGKFVPTWRLVFWIVVAFLTLFAGNLVTTNIMVGNAIRGSEARRCTSVREEVQFFEQNPPENERQRDSERYWQDRLREACPNEGK